MTNAHKQNAMISLRVFARCARSPVGLRFTAAR